jgi:hypothetical protein
MVAPTDGATGWACGRASEPSHPPGEREPRGCRCVCVQAPQGCWEAFCGTGRGSASAGIGYNRRAYRESRCAAYQSDCRKKSRVWIYCTKANFQLRTGRLHL